MKQPNLGVVGATGQVGTMMRTLLLERNFPYGQLRFFASSASAGSILEFDGHPIEVEDASTADYHGLDLVLISAGAAASHHLSPRIAASGAVVIDNSSAWRNDPQVPLVVSEVNPHALLHIAKGIVANPNCTTMVAMPAIAPLHRAFGLRKMVISTYQAVSGMGRTGVGELSDQLIQTSLQASSLTFAPDAVPYPHPQVFPASVAHNVIPFAGYLLDDDTLETSEERKLTDESRKILEIPDLGVAASCVRVPVFTGHSLAITAEFAHPITPQTATAVLSTAPGVALDPLPTPLAATGLDFSLVGRIRQDPTSDHGLIFFVCGDNLRKGAALNAIQIAELLTSTLSLN